MQQTRYPRIFLSALALAVATPLALAHPARCDERVALAPPAGPMPAARVAAARAEIESARRAAEQIVKAHTDNLLARLGPGDGVKASKLALNLERSRAQMREAAKALDGMPDQTILQLAGQARLLKPKIDALLQMETGAAAADSPASDAQAAEAPLTPSAPLSIAGPRPAPAQAASGCPNNCTEEGLCQAAVDVAEGVVQATPDEIEGAVLGFGGAIPNPVRIFFAVAALAIKIGCAIQKCQDDGTDKCALNTQFDTVGTAQRSDKDAILTNDNTNKDAIISNSNTNKDAIISNSNANRNLVTTALSDATQDIKNNDNANRNTIIANDNTNKNTIVANNNLNTAKILTDLATRTERLRVAECEIIRLSVTPLGQRDSTCPTCTDQPGFPYSDKTNAAQTTPTRAGAPAKVAPKPAPGAAGAALQTVAATASRTRVPIMQTVGSMVVETQLLEGRLIPSLYLPAEKGGSIGQVRALVWNRIAAANDMGQLGATRRAKPLAGAADQLLSRHSYVAAYRQYCAAYQSLFGGVR